MDVPENIMQIRKLGYFTRKYFPVHRFRTGVLADSSRQGRPDSGRPGEFSPKTADLGIY